MGNVDVIIVGRGGGSLEDLWPFNEEMVARAIYRSAIPVISAVGHEIDWTIADFVADLRAPTPSAAAEIVISAKREFEDRIHNFRERLALIVNGFLNETRARLRLAVRSYVFREPAGVVRQYQQLVDDYAHRMIVSGKHMLESLGSKADALARQLRSVDPRAVLGRGYSITLDEAGRVVLDAGRLHPKDGVRTILNRGAFTSTVELVEE
jgi:exodeoxyribonuclease VII large subunit